MTGPVSISIEISCATSVFRKKVRAFDSRCLIKRRISAAETDSVEDGGRAWVFEEAISALVFQYARRRRFFDGVDRVDARLLKEIKNLTSGIEVRIRSKADWETAILEGHDIWRRFRDARGGWVSCDLTYKKMLYRASSAEDLERFARRALELEETSQPVTALHSP